MMRLHITVEGRTEESFVNRTLKEHLAQYNVFAYVRCVLTGRKRGKEYRGGMTDYLKAKNDIVRWLQEEGHNNDVAFTTMFDFYALPDDFPGYQHAKYQTDPYRKVSIIEGELASDIGDSRFIPYIQLHEFETLLFVNPQKFLIEYFDYPAGVAQLQKIAEEFSNPELINQGASTAPSKRIINVFGDYEGNKPVVGSMIAHEIGIDALKEGCAHFNEWVTKLERLNSK